MLEALYSEHFRDPLRPVNTARFMFLDPRARTFFPDWDTNMRDAVAALHGEAGRNPYDRGLSDLSDSSRHAARSSASTGRATTCASTGAAPSGSYHPLVGELTLAYERLELPADAGLAIVTYSAEPGPSEERLRELARWASTRSRLATADVTP